MVRFFVMQAHYRSVLDFSSDALEAAEKGYYRLMEGIDRISALKPSAESTFDVGAWRERCFAAMNDDFNTPVLIAHLFEAVGEINRIQSSLALISKRILRD